MRQELNIVDTTLQVRVAQCTVLAGFKAKTKKSNRMTFDTHAHTTRGLMKSLTRVSALGTLRAPNLNT